MKSVVCGITLIGALAGILAGCGDVNARGDAQSSSNSSGFNVRGVEKPAIDFPLSDFELVDQDNKPFKRSMLDGKVWIANFIFTSCPSVCPELTRTMNAVMAKYAGDANVRFVSISVDPETDTPARLREFATQNGVAVAQFERWSFLTGPTKVVDETVLQGFKMAMQRGGGPAQLSHSERFCVVDKKGHVRGAYSVAGDNADIDKLHEHVTSLLAE